MSRFPYSFTNHPEMLTTDLGPHGNKARDALAEKGYVVATGVSQYYAGALGIMAQQRHIVEYCPDDQTTRRFASKRSIGDWLRQGRATFLLLGHPDNKMEQSSDRRDLRVEGYAWTGKKQCEQLPEHPITSAFRLGESALGKHLSADFVQTVVSATDTLYAEGENIGLETWQSNRAVDVYQSTGFSVIAEGPEELRPTLDPEAPDGFVTDVRLYMGYNRTINA